MDLGIVIPTLNCASTLKATLLSLEPFRRRGASLVGVDSGSVDGTLELLEAGVNKVLFNPPGNMYAAINLGLRELDSEWFTYINGDDLLYFDSVSTALKLHGGTSDLVYGCADYIDFEGRLLYSWRSAYPWMLKFLFCNRLMGFPQQGTFFRRKLFAEIGGFNEELKYSGDFDFFLRALTKGYIISRLKHPPIAAFRIHGRQISKRFSTEMCAEGRMSLINCGFSPGSRIERIFVRSAFRAFNLDSLLLRVYRKKCIAGRLALTSSFDC